MRRRWILLALALSFSTRAGAADLRMAAAGMPPSLGNPFTGSNLPSSELWLSIFDSLTLLGWGPEAEPGLALSWENVAPTTWVFHLRPGVTFHNGKPFTADDIVKELALLKQPEGAISFMAAEIRNVTVARARDPLTVEIDTQQPDPILPKRLSVLMVIDPDRWQAVGVDKFTREPVGTGPYQLKSWGAGDKNALLEAFPKSWRAPKSVQTLHYRVIPEHTARLQALMAGQVDMVSGLQIEDIAALKDQGMTVLAQSNPQVKSIALRNLMDGPSPLKDVRVRQALNYAVDRDSIAKLIMLGTVSPVGMGVVPGTTGYNPDVKPYPYDPARAKRLLAEAGYPNGFPMTIDVVTANATPDAQTYEKMAEDLSAVGVKVNMEVITFPDYQAKIVGGKWGTADAFSQIWNNAAYQDPIHPLEDFSCLKPNPFFCDKSLVPLLEQANTEMDLVKREALLKQLMVRYHDDAPAIWLTNAVYVNASNKKTARIDMRPTGVTFETLQVSAP